MPSQAIQGTAVAPGLAVGRVHVVHAGPSDVPTWTVSRDDIPLEIGRLAEALNRAAEKLSARQAVVAASSGEKDAEIFVVHRMILEDPGALKQVEETISDQRINAEAAVKTLIDRFEKGMGDLEGASVRDYVSDIRDPWRFVLEVLLDQDRKVVQEKEGMVILAAAELTPKVVTYFGREKILAVITETGGRFSHGAVLARAFGFPCVIGLSNMLARLEQDLTVLVDAAQGLVVLRPTPEEIEDLEARRRSQQERMGVLARDSARPATTPDQATLAVKVNIESLRDFDTFDVEHVDGIGLLRTEFLYMERPQFPSVEEQYRLYRSVLEKIGDRPATFRLLDIGADKPLPYFKAPPETNPALGWRGIRITLKWSDLLRSQIQALLRASTAGNMKIMLPMVTNVEEIRRIHEIFDEVREGLVSQGYEIADEVPMGVMIEVPSCLLILDWILKEVDFLSVGTNDLVQYLLAVDRDNPWVADLFDPHHPAVFRALDRVARAAHAAGKPLSVCGDVAADPAIALILLALGYSSVSVAPQFIPEIKYAVRRTLFSEVRTAADEILQQDTGGRIRAILDRIRARSTQIDDPESGT
jgi:phosphoenolpyruvate-protein phosphotransferase (PTS system enzyme I)